MTNKAQLSSHSKKSLIKITLIIGLACLHLFKSPTVLAQEKATAGNSKRISIDKDWQFMRYTENADQLIYDERPTVFNTRERIADDKPTEIAAATSSDKVLKKWILPTANEFIADRSKQHIRPEGNPGSDFPFVQSNFNDAAWETVDLPHDWAIKGPFFTEANPIIGGGMGRLPVHGVAWYRKKIEVTTGDKGKEIYLDIDGAMSYAMVWINGKLAGGWPYGYASFRVNLTPYVKYGGINQIAIRLDNPTNSSRWYPGAGIYRNVWLTSVSPIHVAHWGTFVRTNKVSAASARVDLDVSVENNSSTAANIEMVTEVFNLNSKLQKERKAADFPVKLVLVKAGSKIKVENSVTIQNPLLWGPPPSQKPNLYVAVTRLYRNKELLDQYESRFGVRAIAFDPVKGVIVNGEPVRIQGVDHHTDLGALGVAYNERAAERQLEKLKEMGSNAIRISHNPPSPEFLDLTDRMGFLVMNELYDCWERGKNALDFHLIFADWHEPETRAFVRRDRNHPSVMAWSVGNEVGEQYTGEEGAKIARKLCAIVNEEDGTRPTTASANYAKPDMPFPAVFDLISLNYQGEGIRDAPPYSKLTGIKTPPLYGAFHQKFPDKLIISSESASALSSRGTYLFPVSPDESAPVSDGKGGDPKNKYVSAYELYTSGFGSTADKVFRTQDQNPYVGGEFVWSGWDYIGEPTPYYSARSSYSGIIDLAGFKKDRFYLYQARWRPTFSMAHILPHWTWPDRAGKITPVHVFTSGDEAELFLNNQSLGRKKKGLFEYRLKWDSVIYQPGELMVVAYKNGKEWARDLVRTAGSATQLKLTADRTTIAADGKDLSFITVTVLDEKGNVVPEAANQLVFSLSGPGEIMATDNGNAADMTSFSETKRAAFSGMALIIIKAKPGHPGPIEIHAASPGLQGGSISVSSK